MHVCVRVYVYKSQCFGLAPLRVATTANVKSLQLQQGLISHWWKDEVIWENPCTAFGSFSSWGGCGPSLLTISTMPISRSSNIKTELRAMGALRAARETMELSLSAGKVQEKEPQTKCFFQGIWKDISWTVRKKQWLIFCTWERQAREKGTGNRAGGEERKTPNLNCRERIQKTGMLQESCLDKHLSCCYLKMQLYLRMVPPCVVPSELNCSACAQSQDRQD